MPMPEESTDWSLAAQVAAGDDAAFDALMARYKRPVLNFVYRLLGNAADAEDVAQDVFVRAYRSIRQGNLQRTAGQFSTWLFQIARHAALDALRWRRRHPAESLAALEDEGAAAPAAGPAADAEAAARETGARVAAAVARLPEEQRAALVLSVYEDLPQVEIAAVMHSSVRAVEGRIRRARRSLRRELADLLR